MRKESDCPIEQRYLFADEILSNEGIDASRQETIIRFKTGRYKIFDDNKEYVDKYMNWEKQQNEVVLFTLYAYADLSLPVKYNCLFNIANPAEYTISELTVMQSIYEGFYPINTIEDGHKHLLICSFDNGKIPDIISKLYVGKTKYSNITGNSFKMGICNYTDFPFIAERLNKVKILKEKYGNTWCEHDL